VLLQPVIFLFKTSHNKTTFKKMALE